MVLGSRAQGLARAKRAAYARAGAGRARPRDCDRAGARPVWAWADHLAPADRRLRGWQRRAGRWLCGWVLISAVASFVQFNDTKRGRRPNAIHSLRQRGAFHYCRLFFAPPGEKQPTKKKNYHSAEG